MNILINGLHRSGTTFLSRIVNTLPSTFIVKDAFRIPLYYFKTEINRSTNYPRDLYRLPKAKLMLDKEIKDIKYLTDMVIGDLKSNFLDKTEYTGLLDEIMKCRQGETYKNLFSRMFNKIKEIEKCDFIGAKTTNMALYAPEVLDSLPNTKWIEVIRDPRGWRCSAKVSSPGAASAGFWNKAANASLAAAESHRDRYIIITYENLILYPKETLQQICDFVGNKFSISDNWIENLTLVEGNGKTWFSNPSYTKDGKKISGDPNKGIPNEYRIFDNDPVYRWKTRLPRWEKAFFSFATSKNRKRLRDIT
ncbi:MAG: sulfotransferase [Candidatus Omnitrophica bacterium]|nr:sulfotransferase [Candidatus Omnitrophota bacterium]